GSAAVVVSPKYTSEELALAAKLGSVIAGGNIYGITPVANSAILKTNGQTATYEDIVNSSLIVAVDVNLAADFPIVAQKVRKALKKGARLALVGAGNEKFAARAAYKYVSAAEAGELAGLAKEAGNTVVLAGADTMADAGIVNSLTGAKIIGLSAAGNIKGQLAAGIKVDSDDYNKLLADIESGAVKGLLILGDTAGVDARLFKNGIKTVVVTTSLKNVPATADVVLPAATFAEAEGSITNTEGRVRKVTRAIMPAAGKANAEIISELTGLLS
ncbi:hypothetical protein FDZ73_20535, partial [bacterium]